jgi:hypothetical protein
MDKKEYNRLVKKCLKQVRGFSWEKTAKETYAILAEVV